MKEFQKVIDHKEPAKRVIRWTPATTDLAFDGTLQIKTGREIQWTPASNKSAIDGRLRITWGRVTEGFDVSESPSHPDYDGRAFQLDKVGTQEGHSLLISDRSPEYDSCDCPDHNFLGHCKHCSCMRVVLKNDWYKPSEAPSWEYPPLDDDVRDEEATDEFGNAEQRMIEEFSRTRI